jgi:hypothetical protein
MAAVPSRPADPRGAPARVGAPKGVVDLIDRILRDPERTSNFIRILLAVGLVGCVLLYTAIEAMKGMHGLSLRVVVPGGMLSAMSLTYGTIRVVRKRSALGRASAEQQPGGQDAVDSTVPVRKQAQPAKTRIPTQRSRQRSGQSRRRQEPRR